MSSSPLLIAISRPENTAFDDGPNVLTEEEKTADACDAHNHPRLRRSLILGALKRRKNLKLDANSSPSGDNDGEGIISFSQPSKPDEDLSCYKSVHDSNLLTFLTTAWTKWVKLGEERRDEHNYLPSAIHAPIPPLIPSHVPLHHDSEQRPSKNVMGEVGYFCTDFCTPIVSPLLTELCWDGAIVRMAVDSVVPVAGEEDNANNIPRASYAITTHPGHHASYGSFGGYCYVNHAAYAAKYMQSKLNGAKVAILDVDYHCGNGTASIFYNDPTVLVVSIHCDPEWEYPFHSGYADQTGVNAGVGSTLHIPLPPGSKWRNQYKQAIDRAMDAIMDFGTCGLVISLGLDTYEGDSVTVRRAGFRLSGKDYWEMGLAIGAKMKKRTPAVFVQEGGYKMEVVGEAAADVVTGFVVSKTME